MTSTFLFGQNPTIHRCGDDVVVDTYIDGLVDNRSNCITITNTSDVIRTTVEVWIGRNICGQSLPNSIRISGGGTTKTATGIALRQNFSGGEVERMYRTTFTNNASQFCVADLNGCDDAYSMAVYVERAVPGGSSVLQPVDVELWGPRTGNAVSYTHLTLPTNREV